MAQKANYVGWREAMFGGFEKNNKIIEMFDRLQIITKTFEKHVEFIYTVLYCNLLKKAFENKYLRLLRKEEIELKL